MCWMIINRISLWFLVRILRSYEYIENRMILMPDNTGHEKMYVGAGVLPAFWNVFYDGVLRMDLPWGVWVIGYTNDLAVVATGHTTEDLEVAAATTLQEIGEWMRANGLELAAHKTEDTMLNRKRNFDFPVIRMEEHTVDVGWSHKYLGIVLDLAFSFRRHLEDAFLRASRATMALGRLMPNMGRSSTIKRTLLHLVTTSWLMYAALAWVNRTPEFQCNRRLMERTQRLAAIRLIRGV